MFIKEEYVLDSDEYVPIKDIYSLDDSSKNGGGAEATFALNGNKISRDYLEIDGDWYYELYDDLDRERNIEEKGVYDGSNGLISWCENEAGILFWARPG